MLEKRPASLADVLVDRVRRHGVAPAENRNGRGSLPGDGHGLAGVSAVAWGLTADLFDAGAALSLERSDVETDAGWRRISTWPEIADQVGKVIHKAA